SAPTRPASSGSDLAVPPPDVADKPQVVTVQDAPESPWMALLKPAGQVAAILGSIAIVALLAAIMLIQQEDVRNRLLRLAGGQHLSVTTRAFDEASAKVGR